MKKTKHLHSRAPIMSTIKSSLKILSKIAGLFSKTAMQKHITRMNET